MNQRQALNGLTNLAETTIYIRDRLAYGAEVTEDVYNLWQREIEYATRGINDCKEANK